VTSSYPRCDARCKRVDPLSVRIVESAPWPGKQANYFLIPHSYARYSGDDRHRPGLFHPRRVREASERLPHVSVTTLGAMELTCHRFEPVTSAPCSRSKQATSLNPDCAAICIGVDPSLIWAATSMPRSRSKRASSSIPSRDAICNGVHRSWVWDVISATCARNDVSDILMFLSRRQME